MSGRNRNYRLAKIHRTYTVEEVARLYRTHRNTVRAWLREGLPAIDKGRPIIIAGGDLGDFLRARRERNRRPCGVGELYCLRCHVPRKPADNRAAYRALTATSGDLAGICSVCALKMNRRVTLAKLESIRGDLVVSFPVAQEHIGDSPQPSVNCAFR